MEKPSKPTQTMEMNTEYERNRSGIYDQKSAGVTTAGDGLAPYGDKSPVTEGYGSRGDEVKDLKYRKNRYSWMRVELLRLGYTPEEVKIMRTALEDERKHRHKQNKTARYCEANDVDEATAKEQWLERKEREIAKYKAEKAATANIQQKDERKGFADIQQGERPFIRRSDRPTEINSIFERPGEKSREYIFNSPVIQAGFTEADSIHSRESVAKQTKKLVQQFESERDEMLEEVRRRMGLYGKHIWYRSPSSWLNLSKPVKSNRSMAKYPIIIRLVDRSHPFGRICQERQYLLLFAIETTIHDELVTGSDSVDIGGCVFKKGILHLHCKDRRTVEFVKDHLGFYNLLWEKAELYISYEDVDYQYHKVTVYVPNFDMTSEEFFKIIKKQNGYPTEHWPLYSKTGSRNFWALFAVDTESYNRLKANDGYVYFFFGKIQLELTYIKRKGRGN